MSRHVQHLSVSEKFVGGIYVPFIVCLAATSFLNFRLNFVIRGLSFPSGVWDRAPAEIKFGAF